MWELQGFSFTYLNKNKVQRKAFISIHHRDIKKKSLIHASYNIWQPKLVISF